MSNQQTDFYKGMDISFLPELLKEGMQIKDFDDTIIEPFALVGKYGVNAIRLRIWNNPEHVPESKGYCSLAHTIEMAKKIKAHGMSFLLDFHYSDYWADPAKQNKPKAWANLSFEELEEVVYTYTRDTLLSLQAEGVLPDQVQIGNEIRSGLLFPDGELPDYASMVRLVNSGIRGARAVADSNVLKVMLHLDQGGRYFYISEWFTKAIASGLMDFDLIGLSYYPFWHGNFTDLRETLLRLTREYNKPIMIVETAHAWRRSKNGFIDEAQERIAGVPASKEGQKKVLDLVMNIVASLPENRGLGVYYWEPLCLPRPGQSGWSENMGLLDEGGKVMEGIRSFQFTRQQKRYGEYAKVYEPVPITVEIGTAPELPKVLSVLFYDGRIEKKRVSWQMETLGNGWYLQPGVYEIEGKSEDIEENITITVHILQRLPETENLLRDTNWEEGLTQWTIESADEQVMVQLYPEFIEPFPAPPQNTLRVEAPKNFTFQISQLVTITQGCNYTLEAEFMGTDTTNVEIRLFARTEEAEKEIMIHPSEHEWTLYEIKDIVSRQKYLTIGVSITAPPIYCMLRKFKLTKQYT
ncbi:glycosyl hydrolase 53 family protein [Lachnoclostridium sp.]|uniref:glycosyl hydrolase 53 family protein n=1 Tax=Lachnoclostridium sp. TaxID=2028282 RepID=UPI0028A0760D|nr:glycosyl hydrolase 53 family protein [Lachnoclostridium sp.]